MQLYIMKYLLQLGWIVQITADKLTYMYACVWTTAVKTGIQVHSYGITSALAGRKPLLPFVTAKRPDPKAYMQRLT